ncbi:hypothetical protein F5880DRAFT_191299 [Lentinula raphanica]|nr:hypothetical protein F5880DRAFT_191299 [Lentinula raphanica]
MLMRRMTGFLVESPLYQPSSHFFATAFSFLSFLSLLSLPIPLFLQPSSNSSTRPRVPFVTSRRLMHHHPHFAPPHRTTYRTSEWVVERSLIGIVYDGRRRGVEGRRDENRGRKTEGGTEDLAGFFVSHCRHQPISLSTLTHILPVPESTTSAVRPFMNEHLLTSKRLPHRRELDFGNRSYLHLDSQTRRMISPKLRPRVLVHDWPQSNLNTFNTQAHLEAALANPDDWTDCFCRKNKRIRDSQES